MSVLKKLLTAALIAALTTGCAGNSSAPSTLPSPELEEGLRGEQFGIDKNINEATIDQYLGREDTVYRDMRMLKDEADYEAIGGDSWLSGLVEGFEVVPYPYLVNVEGLPAEVGSPYSGNTLFTHDETGYTANYEESMDILEYLFPKDKNIILMCGGGGYAGMTKAMLAELGWDAEKIYNAGGYWYYDGDHNEIVKREENGKTYYDFYKLNYHYIDFESLHPTGKQAPRPESDPVPADDGNFTGLTVLSGEELNELSEKKETFAVSVFLPGCSSCISFAPVVKEVADSNQIPFYAVSWNDAKEAGNEIGTIQYTPSLAVIRDGKMTAYLDASSDDDLQCYKTAEALSEWMQKYVDIETVKGTAENEMEECEDACTAFGDLSKENE